MIQQKIVLRYLLPFVCLLLVAAPAHAQEGVGKRVGEKVDEAVEGIKRGISSASEQARQRFAQIKQSVRNMGVEARIYSRLHWDKDLADAPLDLEVRDGGTAIVRGTVRTQEARQKAIRLANDTVGVVKVEDELLVKEQ